MTQLFEEFKTLALEHNLLDEVDFKIITFLNKYIPEELYSPFNFVVACLQYAVQQGSLCISLQSENLSSRLSSFIQLLPIHADFKLEFSSVTQQFLSALNDGKYASVIGKETDYLPLIQMNGNLYFQKHQSAEAKVGNKIIELVQSKAQPFPPSSVTDIIDVVLNDQPIRISNSPSLSPIQFSSQQIAALQLALTNRFTIINGGPGTGKTSLATNILRAWTRAWFNVHKSFPKINLAAPTGRAAQKLADSIRANIHSIDITEQTASTIDPFVSELKCESLHSLLKYNPGIGRFFYGGENYLSADLIIVDEVSMVDVFVLSQLLFSIQEKSCLIFLGDMDQLPSVESGSVLADLLSGIKQDVNFFAHHPLRNHIITLEKNHRSNWTILNVAESINRMDAGLAIDLIKQNSEFFNWPLFSNVIDYRNQFSKHLEDWIQTHFLNDNHSSYSRLVLLLKSTPLPQTEALTDLLRLLFKHLDQSRILTFTRSGWYGCIAINKMIAEKLSDSWDGRLSKNETQGFHGAPILILENQSSMKLFNGDVGIVLRLGGALQAFFQKGESFVSFSANALPRFELAFASTVHKSQGSEYNQVFLILPEEGNRLLYKETLYTAITRAKSFVKIYGAEKVFREAVSKRIKRESGLLEYIKTKMV